ncbi:hypothetical protein JG688_00017047, partial [Phytophthora aleatoria]
DQTPSVPTVTNCGARYAEPTKASIPLAGGGDYRGPTTVNKNNNNVQVALKSIYVKAIDGKNDVKICQWSQAR